MSWGNAVRRLAALQPKINEVQDLDIVGCTNTEEEMDMSHQKQAGLAQEVSA